MQSISIVVSSPEFWFGVSTAISMEDLARRALKHRLGLDSDDESNTN